MQSCFFAAIDPVATGHNILNLRKERNLSVKDIQRYFHFDEPRAIYKWQSGQSLPSIDNLYALSALFDVPMDDIIVGNKQQITTIEPQETTCGSCLSLHASEMGSITVPDTCYLFFICILLEFAGDEFGQSPNLQKIHHCLPESLYHSLSQRDSAQMTFLLVVFSS